MNASSPGLEVPVATALTSPTAVRTRNSGHTPSITGERPELRRHAVPPDEPGAAAVGDELGP